ncbi:hypothetical protein ColLi_12906 [Colletotrichum liriopes]|uniref:Uncharacterized protein n=1 Tax=Colletotrichum liriopes TaxID=708192 RepID=A0AA37H1W1_9PEZI|nr:hypothetical protein ColLi_12906 [Colletotrichum liriopes]
MTPGSEGSHVGALARPGRHGPDNVPAPAGGPPKVTTGGRLRPAARGTRGTRAQVLATDSPAALTPRSPAEPVRSTESHYGAPSLPPTTVLPGSFNREYKRGSIDNGGRVSTAALNRPAVQTHPAPDLPPGHAH